MGHIIAMGGGGFSMEPENPALDRYIIAQTGAADMAGAFAALTDTRRREAAA